MPGAVLRTLFDRDVAVSVLTDFAQAGPLHAEEAARVAKAVAKRRLEYAAGRTCARRALAEAGCPGVPTLLSLEDRRVDWPSGFLGTVTHTRGLAAAAVASAGGEVCGLGLDAEERGRVEDKLYPQIAGDAEIDWIRAGGAHEGDRATLLFSAKEAFYKAQYALSETFLGFHDVRFVAHDEGFTIELLADVPALAAYAGRFEGRLAHTPEHVLTAVTLRR